MAVLANVTLTNTFDEWRTRTNQIIYKLDQLETTNTIYLASNSTNALSIQGTANLGSNVFLVIRTSNSVFDQANANIASMFVANQIHELARTSFDSSNTVYGYAANTVLLVANTAYDKANAANVYADNSYLLGQLGFNKANTANVLAFSAQGAAAAAYAAQNTTYTYAANNVMRAANSAYAAQNTTYTYAANNVMRAANSAYAAQNTTYTYAANTVMRAANTAHNKANSASIIYVIDGGGSPISNGVKGYLEVPFACTIQQATLMADQTGNVAVDIWKDTYANYPPTIADSITSASKPTITLGTKTQDSTLTGWTKTINSGDILAFQVPTTANDITRVTLSMEVKKT